ncbi:transcriptional regulator [Moraxella atlantae]|nr:helix-turn-helix domain-containing protein [Moraxella atlantae]OPH35176.1 transcriptional regulator [Moraxella atlantae]
MYIISINNHVVKQTDNPNIAWANYRSFARDQINKSANVTISKDGAILHQKDADKLLLEDINVVTTNDLFNLVLATLNFDSKRLKKLVADSDLSISNSRIDGWTRKIDDRRYVDMHNDELAAILELLLTDLQTSIKSPANIAKMRKKLGLTQAQLAQELGLKSGFRQVARWEAGEQEMPDVRWKKLQGLIK